MKNSYREIYKERLTADMLERLDLRRQTLDQLVDIQLLQSEATRIGFTVSDEEVREEIAKIEAFQEHGSFSQDRFTPHSLLTPRPENLEERPFNY
jgi:parvulin-like peptidyl-prolyl isomerase